MGYLFKNMTFGIKLTVNLDSVLLVMYLGKLIKLEMFHSPHLLYRDNNKIYLIDFLFKIEWDKLYNMLGIEWVLKNIIQ